VHAATLYGFRAGIRRRAMDPVFVSVGLIVSVLGAYPAWSLICVEVIFCAAKNRDMPRGHGCSPQKTAKRFLLPLCDFAMA